VSCTGKPSPLGDVPLEEEGEDERDIDNVSAVPHDLRAQPPIAHADDRGLYSRDRCTIGIEEFGKRAVRAEGQYEHHGACQEGRPVRYRVEPNQCPGEEVPGEQEVRVHQQVQGRMAQRRRIERREVERIHRAD